MLIFAHLICPNLCTGSMEVYFFLAADKLYYFLLHVNFCTSHMTKLVWVWVLWKYIDEILIVKIGETRHKVLKVDTYTLFPVQNALRFYIHAIKTFLFFMNENSMASTRYFQCTLVMALLFRESSLRFGKYCWRFKHMMFVIELLSRCRTSSLFKLSFPPKFGMTGMESFGPFILFSRTSPEDKPGTSLLLSSSSNAPSLIQLFWRSNLLRFCSNLGQCNNLSYNTYTRIL